MEGFGVAGAPVPVPAPVPVGNAISEGTAAPEYERIGYGAMLDGESIGDKRAENRAEDGIDTMGVGIAVDSEIEAMDVSDV